jgi:CDP-diacylglycerol--glycerol-3-phosphate 3-phosphatidyltransferase
MARSVKPARKQASRLNPANLLTMLRIVLVPVFVSLMLYREPAWSLAVFATAAVTDLADGWLARRYGWVTALGIFIDPMADKLLQLSAVTLMAWQGHAQLWVAVLLWARETIVVIGFTVLAVLGVSREVRSSWWGKASTLAQMAALAGCLAVPAVDMDPEIIMGLRLFLAGATVLNFLSGLEYAWHGFQAYELEQGKKGRLS